jgi:hypothetical protein
MRVVYSIRELEALGRDRAANGLFERSPISLSISGLEQSHRVRIEQALNRFQSHCGCEVGAFVFLAAVVFGGVRIALASPNLLSIGFVLDVAGALLAAFAVGFLAKIAAMAVTRLRFASACFQFARELEAAPGPALMGSA